MDRDQVIAWAKDTLETDTPKLGANLLYDLGWLATEGVYVKGNQYDVQIAEPLIDENARRYALSALCKKYGTEGKDEKEMYEWQAETFGGRANRKQAANIWKTPSEIVGPYAESDVREPFDVFDKQRKIISSEGLSRVFDIETRLIPMLHAMRTRGVLIDVYEAEKIKDRLSEATTKAEKIVEENEIDIWANATIARYCDANGIEYLITAPTETFPEGQPSFQSAWLEKQDDEVLRRIADCRRYDTNVGKFITSQILGEVVVDRIHCQFNQLRGDKYGTVSGRFSSSNPNLQNIPVRDEELGPLMRALFIADEGQIWYSDDWSQIEFRLLVHYGALDNLPTAIKTLRAYIDKPETDFHEWTAQLTGIDRKPAKNINFGLIYGMGKGKMARQLGLEEEEAAIIRNQYHKELPFVKQMLNNLSKKAASRGHITTLLGRRRRYELWEPSDFEKARDCSPVSFEEAKKLWVNERWHDAPFFTQERAGLAGNAYGGGPYGIRRAKAYTALNALLQGGAADLMKLAMVEIWESGICDVLGAPLLTVHDELNWSAPDTKEAAEAHEEARRIMAKPHGIQIPLLVDSGSGRNWAEAK
jgi:DNA polymerase I-like protein with 3'-5' exonuclease and polymerase domains